VADNGHTAYIAVNPDGTVEVPTQVDVAGVIAKGDYATHADLAAYETITDLNVRLADYERVPDLNARLAAYETTADLDARGYETAAAHTADINALQADYLARIAAIDPHFQLTAGHVDITLNTNNEATLAIDHQMGGGIPDGVLFQPEVTAAASTLVAQSNAAPDHNNIYLRVMTRSGLNITGTFRVYWWAWRAT
jgi:hypothetical protein